MFVPSALFKQQYPPAPCGRKLDLHELYCILRQLPEAMAPTIEAVRNVGADLGIVLDTDVDRSGVVDRNGEAINRNRLIAFLATVVLRDSPATTIVTDSTTSNGLKVRFCGRRGIIDSNVVTADFCMRTLNAGVWDVTLGGVHATFEIRMITTTAVFAARVEGGSSGETFRVETVSARGLLAISIFPALIYIYTVRYRAVRC